MKALHQMAWLLGLCLLLGTAAQTLAAAGKHGGGDKLTGIVAQLNLDSDNQDKANTIISDLQTKMRSIRKDAKASGDKDAAKDKIKEARRDAIKKISDLLTDDQKTQFKDLLKQAEASRKAAKADSATTQPAQ